MKAVVYHGPHNVKVEEVQKPSIQDPQDVILKVTLSTLCGTDLHPYRGSLSGFQDGTIMGHEFVGVVDQVGGKVKNLQPGDRVLVPSTIACGYCSYCTEGLYAQCENANPITHSTAFYGGPREAGGFAGGQAEYVRVPFATVGPVKIPDNVADEQAVLLTDIVPTGYFGAELALIEPGEAVAVFGAGPVGLMAMESARLMDAGRVFAIDSIDGRLKIAAQRGFEALNFSSGDLVEQIMDLTGGHGVDAAIDAVGVDSHCALPGQGGDGQDCSTQAIRWAVSCVKKAGMVSVIGLYPPTVSGFPLGQIIDKNLSLSGGSCNHRKYIPPLLRLIQDGTLDPSFVITDTMSLEKAAEAYAEFDAQQNQHLKIVLETPASVQIAG